MSISNNDKGHLKILVVLAHPDPKSFNHAIAQCVIDTIKKYNREFIYHDLYQEKFNPILPTNEIPEDAPVPKEIMIYGQELKQTDGIVIIHPNWWGQPPAILKGWVDRVFRPGLAYKFKEGDPGAGIPIGLLNTRWALVLNTANTPQEREDHVFGDPLQRIWSDCILKFCGIDQFKRKIYRIVCTSTPAERQAWLDNTAQTLEEFLR